MASQSKTKGTWMQTFGLFVLGAVLGILLFWLFGFITRDIDAIKGPDYSTVRAGYVSSDVDDTAGKLKSELAQITDEIKDRQQQQQIILDATQSLQNTINQLLSIQKLNVERGSDLSAEQLKVLNDSQNAFLQQQTQYQSLNAEIATLTARRQSTARQLDTVEKQIAEAQAPARAEYNRLKSRHDLRMAALKLAIMLPIFIVAALVFLKARSSAWWPIVYAAFVAAFIRVALIIHEYFPSRYFKYIAIFVVIAIVMKLLVCLIRRIISPKPELLVRRRQEAYDKHRCPICSKPIKTGLLTYMRPGRRSVVVTGDQTLSSRQPYTCPSCGSTLFEKCPACSETRHALLPFCEHCGAEKGI